MENLKSELPLNAGSVAESSPNRENISVESVSSSLVPTAGNADVTSQKKRGRRSRSRLKLGREAWIEHQIIQLEMRIDGTSQHLLQSQKNRKNPDMKWVMKETLEMVGLIRSIRNNYRLLKKSKQWTLSTGSGKFNTKSWSMVVNRRRRQAP